MGRVCPLKFAGAWSVSGVKRRTEFQNGPNTIALREEPSPEVIELLW
jgi:hypothetical protein